MTRTNIDKFSVKFYLNRLKNSRDKSVFKIDIAEAKFYPVNLFVNRCHPWPILQSSAVLARKVGKSNFETLEGVPTKLP